MWQESGCHMVGDKMGTDRVFGECLLSICWDCLQPLRLVWVQFPTNRRPVPHILATTKIFYDQLVAERFHLQQAKSHCDQIVFVTIMWPLQPIGDLPDCDPCNLPATTWNNPLQGGRRQVASNVSPGLNRVTVENYLNVVDLPLTKGIWFIVELSNRLRRQNNH